MDTEDQDSQGNNEDPTRGVKRDMLPEQGMFDPITGLNVTGDLSAEARKEMEDGLTRFMELALERGAKGEDSQKIFSELSAEIEKIIERYYRFLKRPTDETALSLHLEKLRESLNTFERIISELEIIGMKARQFGLDYKITSKPHLLFHFGWENGEDRKDHGPEHQTGYKQEFTPEQGLWITFSEKTMVRKGVGGRGGEEEKSATVWHPTSTLLAIPITNIQTTSYGPYFFGGEPPAADIVRITEKAMIFVSQDSMPPSEFLQEIATASAPAIDFVPLCTTSQCGPLLEVEVSDPVCVDIPASPSTEEILKDVFGNHPDILAISIVTSGYPIKKIFTRSSPLFKS